MISFFDPAARWAFVLGAALGAGPLYLLGWYAAFFELRWARVAWHEVRRWNRLRKLRQRNPLTCVLRAYSELWRDIVHLCETGELRPGR